ncbi:putative protein phosphatase 2C 48 [Zea mays]|uniref:Uncharacterized protein n=1 Tax=Zea mays TaxID=4577 RepID=A0A3L6E6W7_MAIZE|nr:putative protein phosphatase 2C 48 [Zea mays]
MGFEPATSQANVPVATTTPHEALVLATLIDDEKKLGDCQFDLWKQYYVAACVAVFGKLHRSRCLDALQSGCTALSISNRGTSWSSPTPTTLGLFWAPHPITAPSHRPAHHQLKLNLPPSVYGGAYLMTDNVRGNFYRQRMVGFDKLPKYHQDPTAEELAKTLDCWPSMNYYITGCRYDAKILRRNFMIDLLSYEDNSCRYVIPANIQQRLIDIAKKD